MEILRRRMIILFTILIFYGMGFTQRVFNFEEALEMDENELTEDIRLSDVPEYDSLTKLTLIVLCDDEFDKKLTGEQIKEFKTVKDILDFMG